MGSGLGPLPHFFGERDSHDYTFGLRRRREKYQASKIRRMDRQTPARHVKFVVGVNGSSGI